MKAFVLYGGTNDAWKVRKGYRAVVMNGGAVRFDFPSTWLPGLDSKYLRIIDREPPDDRCSLMASSRRISAHTAGFPVRELLHEVTAEDSPARRSSERGPVVGIFRPPLEAAWRQIRFTDSVQ